MHVIYLCNNNNNNNNNNNCKVKCSALDILVDNCNRTSVSMCVRVFMCEPCWWTTQKRSEIDPPFFSLNCRSYAMKDHDLDETFEGQRYELRSFGKFICDYHDYLRYGDK